METITPQVKNDVERRILKTEELRVKKVEDDVVIFGYAVLFGVESERLGFCVEKFEPGVFKKSIDDGDDVRALFNHNVNCVLGRTSAKTLTVEEDEKGLKFEIVLPDNTVGKDLAVSIERRDITGMSVGFKTNVDEWHYEGDLNRDTLRIIKEAELKDVSVATLPAYPDTSVALRSFDAWKEAQGKESPGQKDKLRLRIKLAEIDL